MDTHCAKISEACRSNNRRQCSRGVFSMNDDLPSHPKVPLGSAVDPQSDTRRPLIIRCFPNSTNGLLSSISTHLLFMLLLCAHQLIEYVCFSTVRSAAPMRYTWRLDGYIIVSKGYLNTVALGIWQIEWSPIDWLRVLIRMFADNATLVRRRTSYNCGLL